MKSSISILSGYNWPTLSLYSSTGPTETGLELSFLRALLALRKDSSTAMHEKFLDDVKDQLRCNLDCFGGCAEGEEKRRRISSSLLYSKFLVANPNFVLELAEVTYLLPTFLLLVPPP